MTRNLRVPQQRHALVIGRRSSSPEPGRVHGVRLTVVRPGPGGREGGGCRTASKKRKPDSEKDLRED